MLPLKLFLSFNRIKDCLSAEVTEQAKLDSLAAAVKKSNMLKLSKCGKLLKRRLPFNIERIDNEKMDACTVYVENFPENLTLEHIAKIFARAGEIRNVTLPKFKQKANLSPDDMQTDESQAPTKGFCFVEFDSEDAANRAVMTFNNCVPEEFQNAEHKNYFNVQGQLSQLNVMKKEVWRSFKEEVIKIRQEIARLNSAEMFVVNEPKKFEGFAEGTLLRITHNMNLTSISKSTLRQAMSHFGSIAYIDLHGKVVQTITLRFNSKIQTAAFISKASTSDSLDIS